MFGFARRVYRRSLTRREMKHELICLHIPVVNDLVGAADDERGA